jgi:hypothetical protein
MNSRILLRKCYDAMNAANELIHDYRNSPGKVINNTKQVDPVIHNLRVVLSEIETFYNHKEKT